MANPAVIIDRAKVCTAVHSGAPLSITTYTLPPATEAYMQEILSIFLSEIGQSEMLEYLSYCLRELAANAKKANTKRIYFLEKRLSLLKQEDYEKGMTTFKQETLDNMWYYLKLQKEAGLYIKMDLQYRNGAVWFEIRNRASLSPFEYRRMHDKIERTRFCDSVDKVADQLLDDSEGAGLGITIILIMLKKLGMAREDFRIISEKGETIIRVRIPADKNHSYTAKAVSSEILGIMDKIPHFPENIEAINRLINSPSSKLSDIALRISSDVMLTADILKMVNSAAFNLKMRCSNIADAVRLVGVRSIQNMLYSIGSIKNLNFIQSDKTRQLWTHANQVAFYAYNLARNLCPGEPNAREDSYVCGLLHDIGKILFHAAYPLLKDDFIQICRDKDYPLDVLERLSSGINHAEIGSLVVEKWNFPMTIINVIKYHHLPLSAPKQDRVLTCVVYLADMMSHYQDGSIEYNQFNPEVLDYFNIESEEQLAAFSSRLQTAFERSQDN